MAITKFIPAKSTIRDNRSEDGGYYVATCNVCGTEFYPKRSNAKYCSNKCTVNNHRNSNLTGDCPKKSESKKQTIEKGLFNFTGRPKVYQYLKNRFETRGDRLEIIDNLKILEIGENYKYKKVIITKISEAKYSVQDDSN